MSAETKSTIYHFEDGILHSVIKPDRIMTLMEATENSSARKNLDITFPVPILLDIRNLADMSLEAILATGNQADLGNFSAAALLVADTIHDIIARESKRFKKKYRSVQSL